MEGRGRLTKSPVWNKVQAPLWALLGWLTAPRPDAVASHKARVQREMQRVGKDRIMRVFSVTRRRQRSRKEDDLLQALLENGTPAATLVLKNTSRYPLGRIPTECNPYPALATGLAQAI